MLIIFFLFLSKISFSHQLQGVKLRVKSTVNVPQLRGSQLRVKSTNNDGNDYLIDDVARVAESAARKAGSLILAGMGSKSVNEKLNFKDIVTEVDGNCQNIIRAEIFSVFPDHYFLGEEDILPGGVKSFFFLLSKKNKRTLFYLCLGMRS